MPRILIRLKYNALFPHKIDTILPNIKTKNNRKIQLLSTESTDTCTDSRTAICVFVIDCVAKPKIRIIYICLHVCPYVCCSLFLNLLRNQWKTKRPPCWSSRKKKQMNDNNKSKKHKKNRNAFVCKQVYILICSKYYGKWWSVPFIHSGEKINPLPPTTHTQLPNTHRIWR